MPPKTRVSRKRAGTDDAYHMAFYFLPLGSRGATYAPITNGRLNRKVFKTDVFVNKAGKPVPRIIAQGRTILPELP